MHHTLAFFENVTPNSAYTYIAALADPTVLTKDDNLYLGEFCKIIAVQVGGEKLLRARLTSPALRRFAYEDLRLISGEDRSGRRVPIEWRPLSPLGAESQEGLNCEVYSTQSSGFDYWCGLLLATAPVSPVFGDIRTLRFTLSGTSVKNQWVNFTLSFDQTLPKGRYQVVGCSLQCGDGVIFRLQAPGVAHRPGGFITWWLCHDIPEQRMGRLGVWLEFEHITPPSLDLFQTGTATPGEGMMDLIKVA